MQLQHGHGDAVLCSVHRSIRFSFLSATPFFLLYWTMILFLVTRASDPQLLLVCIIRILKFSAQPTHIIMQMQNFIFNCYCRGWLHIMILIYLPGRPFSLLPFWTTKQEEMSLTAGLLKTSRYRCSPFDVFRAIESQRRLMQCRLADRWTRQLPLMHELAIACDPLPAQIPAGRGIAVRSDWDWTP